MAKTASLVDTNDKAIEFISDVNEQISFGHKKKQKLSV